MSNHITVSRTNIFWPANYLSPFWKENTPATTAPDKVKDASFHYTSLIIASSVNVGRCNRAV